MRLEIKYHRLQAKIAAMKENFEQQTLEIRRENSNLKKQVRELNKRLENAKVTIEREKNANKEWRTERTNLLKTIRDLKLEIDRLNGLVANMKTACKVSPNDVWKIKEFPELRKRYLEAVENRRI